ncbi:inositol-1,3,4-trisphosphate 5/6-kinase [Ranunculus cassubicifolius]
MGGSGGDVRGILLDESLLFAQENKNKQSRSSSTFFQSGAEDLLRRLQYSKIQIGISYGEDTCGEKVTFLEEIAKLYSLDSFNISSIDQIISAWPHIQGTRIYVTGSSNSLNNKLKDHHWFILTLNPLPSIEEEESITRLEELPLALSRFNKKASDGSVLTVGYVMKPSREDDFAKRGAFPMHTTNNGLMFVPLSFDLPLASQLQQVDVVLHKATDQVISIGFSEGSSKTLYTKGMQELQRYFQDHPDCCVIDPLDNISPVLDRLRMQQILLGLENLKTDGQCRIRAPHFLKVDDFNDPKLGERLSEVNLYLPSIVKPQVACGVADAHDMAIVFRTEDFKSLEVPLPAVVQEYVDHSSLLYKLYVLGEKVFYSVKNSTPNSDVFLSSYEKDGHKPIIFNSLKSLPIAAKKKSDDDDYLDVELATEAANWLRKKLSLTIFGFDIVIQQGSRDHVVVDVNYLPSFKEVADEVAIPAFWDAIKMSYHSTRELKSASAAAF